MIDYLTKEEIIFINKRTVEAHGGNFVPPDNFLHEPPLDYLLEAVEAEMFGTPLYPEIHQKAGLYMFNIIGNHIFQDGNKRTGLQAASLFLQLNSYNLNDNLSRIQDGQVIKIETDSNSKILIDFTLDVASGKIDLDSCQNWFKQNISPIK